MDFNAWAWAGDYYSCSGWSPDPSTYDSGVAFTQTAYCYRNQQRGAAGYIYNGGWVPDPAVPYRTETVAYSGQPIYNTAYGTRPTTVCRYDANNKWGFVQMMDHVTVLNMVMWDGVQFQAGLANQVTSYTYNGVVYKRGAMVSTNLYQVCRG
jgi:hypothetical protein